MTTKYWIMLICLPLAIFLIVRFWQYVARSAQAGYAQARSLSLKTWGIIGGILLAILVIWACWPDTEAPGKDAATSADTANEEYGKPISALHRDTTFTLDGPYPISIEDNEIFAWRTSRPCSLWHNGTWHYYAKDSSLDFSQPGRDNYIFKPVGKKPVTITMRFIPARRSKAK